jgi:hypothetical protein
MANYRVEFQSYCGYVQTCDFEAPNNQIALSITCDLLGTKRPLPYIKAEFFKVRRILCLGANGSREVQFDEVEPLPVIDFSRLSRQKKGELYIVLT